MQIRRALVPLLLLSPSLPSQGTTAPPAPPPQVRVDTVGPDGWRLRYGPTNVGSLLESEQGRKLWEPRLAPLFGVWQQALGDDAAFTAMRTRVIGYGGRIRAGLWFDANRNRGDTPRCAAVVFDGDGRTDLALLQKELRDLLYRTTPGEWTGLQVDGTQIEVRRNGDDLTSAPLLEGGHLLLVHTSDGDLPAALALARPLAADLTGRPPAPNTPALEARFDMAALAAQVIGGGGGESAVMKALGFDSLRTATVTLGTAGPQVQVEVAQQFAGDQRGLFGLLFPAATGASPLLHAVPADAPLWKVGRLDLGRALQIAEDVSVALREVTAEQFRAECEQEFGIDLRQDLLPHLTDEAMLLGSPLGGLDSMTEATWSLVIRLRDDAAFGKALLRMLPKAKPFLSREAEGKHGDIPVYRYGGMLGYDLWLAVGNGVLTIAGGRDAEEELVAVLDLCKALPAAADWKAAAATADFAALQRHFPAGLNGLAKGDVGSFVMLPSTLWLELLGEFAPVPDPDAGNADVDSRKATLELLRQHNLAVLRTASGFAEEQWRWRLFW